MGEYLISFLRWSKSNYVKVKIISDDDLRSEKTMNNRNIVILLKPIFNESHNHYYYQVHL